MQGMRAPNAFQSVTRRRALGVAAAAGASFCLTGRALAAHTVKPWPAARPVPELDVSDLDGKPWKLEAHAGKVVVLNFWATWCEPCRLEMPSLDAMALKLKPQGLVVGAVNYKETAETIRQFLSARRSRRRSARSRGRRRQRLDAAFPSTVLIGRNGKPMPSSSATSTGWAASPRAARAALAARKA
jgi:thiol-disulfide isomerase/thioredoxin